MKRLFAILCALAMLLTLGACSMDPGTPVPGETQTGLSGDTAASPTTPFVTFEEVTIVDNDLCTVRVTEIDPDALFGYSLKVLLENKSADKTYMFSVSSAAINGVEADPFFATEVAAGKKSNEDLVFSLDTLEENGVGPVTDIELNFRVYDSDDWTSEAATATAHVYPLGQEQAVKFVRQPQPEDTVLVDNEAVTVTVIGYRQDPIWGYTADLFLLNKTDKALMVSMDDVSVNGFMVDPFYADSVSPGNCAFSSASWSDTDLSENGIAQVETIEFVLRVYDETDWLADDVANETVTLNP